MACGPIDGVWYCDGIACDKKGIHTTCKNAKEAEGYTFAYTERARLAQAAHDRERDLRLIATPLAISELEQPDERVLDAIHAAGERLEKNEYFKK